MEKILIALGDGPASEKVAVNGIQFARQLPAEIAPISVIDSIAHMADGVVSPGEMANILKSD